MKTLNQITMIAFVAVAAMLMQPAAVSAAPQAGCDSGSTLITGGPTVQVANSGCDGGCDGTAGDCDGNCRGARMRLGRRGSLLGRVRCPDCDECFPEEYCQVKVEQVDVEKTCFEVDYKTICIPKVVPPWKTRARGCSGCQSGCQSGACDGGCDGAPTGGCDGCATGACDGGCDGLAAGGCCGKCRPGLAGRCCQGKGQHCDPNAPHKCCPSSTCAEARSVKILKKKKYKCPGCRCKWEVLKPELQSPTPQPAPAAAGTPTGNQMFQTPRQPTAPAAPALNDYYGAGSNAPAPVVTLSDRPVPPIRRPR